MKQRHRSPEKRYADGEHREPFAPQFGDPASFEEYLAHREHEEPDRVDA